MSDKTNRCDDNVPGPWYVDNSCIICGLCAEYAPDVFRVSADFDHNYVFHQPVTPEELKSAEDAHDHCPVDAIGNDG
jgi:ferredoxin